MVSGRTRKCLKYLETHLYYQYKLLYYLRFKLKVDRKFSILSKVYKSFFLYRKVSFSNIIFYERFLSNINNSWQFSSEEKWHSLTIQSVSKQHFWKKKKFICITFLKTMTYSLNNWNVLCNWHTKVMTFLQFNII